ncbi:hypothetical protein [Arthrobacter sp. FW306-04-A]|uniref:hypothetical protein n=1 Tax=Arthrobacter sp. FW306-04-A TaxID=2879619 RepID=UPI0037BEA048|nr:hypothetical protein LFT43_12380 [Arthrobacter sp. FW306-04-A]
MATEYEDRERLAATEFLTLILVEDWFKGLEIVQLQELIDGAVERRWPTVWFLCPQGHKLANMGLLVRSSAHRWIKDARSKGRITSAAPESDGVAYVENLVEGFRYNFECPVPGCRSKSTPVRDSTLLKLYAAALRSYADSLAGRDDYLSKDSGKSVRIGAVSSTKRLGHA